MPRLTRPPVIAPVQSQPIASVHWVWPVNANLGYKRQRIETLKTHLLYNNHLMAITPQMKPIATLTTNTINAQKTKRAANVRNSQRGRAYSATQSKNTGV